MAFNGKLRRQAGSPARLPRWGAHVAEEQTGDRSPHSKMRFTDLVARCRVVALKIFRRLAVVQRVHRDPIIANVDAISSSQHSDDTINGHLVTLNGDLQSSLVGAGSRVLKLWDRRVFHNVKRLYESMPRQSDLVSAKLNNPLMSASRQENY
jgi:hypothetical protein